KWLGEHRLDKLARLWMQGTQIDWTLLYADDPPASRPRRISLPTYPFARERYGWPAHHAMAHVAHRPTAEVTPGRAAASESLSGTLLLQPVWEPVAVDAYQGPIWPSSTERLLVVGGDDQMRQAVRAQFPGACICHIGAEDTVDDIVARLAEA